MADVVTRVSVNDYREIPALENDVNGAYLEYRFQVDLRHASEIYGSQKRLALTLIHESTGQKPPIEVSLVAPGTAHEFEVEESDQSSVIYSAASMVADVQMPQSVEEVAAPREATNDAQSVQFLMARKARISDGRPVFDGGPGTYDPSPVGDRYEYYFHPDGPNGEWKLRIKNRGPEPAKFRILISHPGMQLQLSESKIPLSLMNRMLHKLNRLAGLRVETDGEPYMDFRREFKELTGIERQPLPIPDRISNVSLDHMNVKLLGATDTSLRLVADAFFDTSSWEEIAVSCFDDIDITHLSLQALLEFRGHPDTTKAVYQEQRDVAGSLQAAWAPAGLLALKIEADIRTDSFQGRVSGIVDDTTKHFLENPRTKEALNIIAEHVTDALLFLAVGNEDRVFFDLGVTETDIVVRHYPKSSRRLWVLPVDRNELVDSGVVRKMSARMRHPSLSGDETEVSPALSDSSSSALAPSKSASDREMLIVAGDETSAKPRKIDHIVVLMLENRSFDHMLGYLSLDGGREDIDGLKASSNYSNPVPGSTERHSVHRLTDGGVIRFDPGHGVDDVIQQIADGDMSGFVENYMSKDSVKSRPGEEKQVMGYYSNDLLETYDDLAREYLICDRWFCSHPGATQPNRIASLTGGTPSLSNFRIDDAQMGTLEIDTIFDLLTEAGVTWNYVESNVAFLRLFDKYRVDELNIVQLSDWLERARAGQLPAVSWIDPNYGDIDIDELADDDHPPANVVMGQRLVESIYSSLTAHSEQWGKTLFIVTYDEHGGFYDHVTPHGFKGEEPAVPKIHPQGMDYLGPRVPTLVVSPWVKPGAVSSQIFDHTSLLKTILLNFLGPDMIGRELMGPRTDAANDLLGLLEPVVRADAPKIAQSIAIPPSSTEVAPVESNSFHLGMQLFGFGPRVRRIAAERAAV